MDRRVQCRVVEGDTPVKEAQGFRIVAEVGREVFLDFMAPSKETEQLEVVLRMRLQRDTLAAIRDRLVTDVLEFPPGMMVN